MEYTYIERGKETASNMTSHLSKLISSLKYSAKPIYKHLHLDAVLMYTYVVFASEKNDFFFKFFVLTKCQKLAKIGKNVSFSYPSRYNLSKKGQPAALKVCAMVLLLDGSSEHVVHAWWRTGLL